mgnify:CR=1 FL=1
MATPDRRALLRGSSAAALGITSTALPAASAAASPVPDGSVQLASTTVTLTPRGYGDTGTTGAIGVSWGPVTNADSYTVWKRSGSDPFAQDGDATADTSAVLSGLDADTAYDVYVVASADDPAYASSLSTTVSANSSIATGGTIVRPEGEDYVVHIFKNTGGDQTSATFRLNRDIDVHHLVVAGGGGGGGDVGGGGGAGGLLTSIGGTAVPRTAGDHAIRVGRGGDGGAVGSAITGIGDDGFASSAFGSADDDPGVVYAVGGGGGGTWGAGDPGTEPGRDGGSGGGGGGFDSASDKSGGSATFGQGNAGGAGWQGMFAGGGGGGAGGAGTTATDNSGAAGGAGLAVAIVPATTAAGNAFGEVVGGSVYFAGGGGAGANGAAGAGGVGGGGDGTDRANETVGAAGEAATGGGGGAPGGPYGGGAGGSGVVVLRYELPA